jgi:hypothetical protein
VEQAIHHGSHCFMYDFQMEKRWVYIPRSTNKQNFFITSQAFTKSLPIFPNISTLSWAMTYWETLEITLQDIQSRAPTVDGKTHGLNH